MSDLKQLIDQSEYKYSEPAYSEYFTHRKILTDACIYGDIPIVEYILDDKRKKNIESFNLWCRISIQITIRRKHISLLKVLLNYKSVRHKNFINSAIRSKSTECLNMILEHNLANDIRPIYLESNQKTYLSYNQIAYINNIDDYVLQITYIHPLQMRRYAIKSLDTLNIETFKKRLQYLVNISNEHNDILDSIMHTLYLTCNDEYNTIINYLVDTNTNMNYLTDQKYDYFNSLIRDNRIKKIKTQLSGILINDLISDITKYF